MYAAAEQRRHCCLYRRRRVCSFRLGMTSAYHLIFSLVFIWRDAYKPQSGSCVPYLGNTMDLCPKPTLRKCCLALWCIASLVLLGQPSSLRAEHVFGADEQRMVHHHIPLAPAVFWESGSAAPKRTFRPTPAENTPSPDFPQDVRRFLTPLLAPAACGRSVSALPSTPLNWRGIVPLRSPPLSPLFV